MDSPSPSNTPDQSLTRYATFTSRFRAVIIDTAVVLGVVIFVVISGDFVDRIPGSGRVEWLLMFGALVLYEPLFVWRRGATVGHALNHLVVVDDRSEHHPTLGQAFARYFLKLVLGIPSFVTMALTRRYQTAHDLLTHTTVRLAASAEPDTHAFHVERTEDGQGLLPSRLRRAVVMVVYLAAINIGYGMLLLALDPERCLRAQSCTTGEHLLTDAATLMWLAGSLAAIVAVWKGYLPGARRDRTATSGSLAA